MKRSNQFAIALAVFSASAVPTLAQDVLPSSGDSFTIYGEVEDWTIYLDNDRGTCLAERSDIEGNVIQMGLTKDQKYGYVGVFTKADIDTKGRQEIAIAVDGEVFAGESHGIKSKKLGGEYSGGYILTNNPDMVTAIANGKTLVAFPEKTGAFTVDLTGTKRAIEEARKCTQEATG